MEKKINNVVAATPANKVLRDRYGNVWVPPTEAQLAELEAETAAYNGCGSWNFDFKGRPKEILTPTGGKIH